MTRTQNARLAGITFLAYIAIGIAALLIGNAATAGGGVAAKLASVARHAGELRLVAVLSLASCFAALILGVTLYAITRDEDRDLAMLALVCRVIEGVPGVSGALGLVWLTTAADAKAFDPAMTQAFGAYLMRGEAGTGAIFFAVASTLFAGLMLRGRMVPAWLARLGLAASAFLVVVLPLQLGGVFVGGALSWA